MKKKLKVWLMILVLLLILTNIVTNVFAGQEKKPDSITIFGGTAGGSWFTTGAFLSEIFRKGGVKSSVELGGGVSNIVMVDRQEGELGFTMNLNPSIARKGEPPFDEKYTDAMGVCTISTSYVIILVREDSGISNIKELEGKKFASQPEGSGTALCFKNVLNAYGLNEDDLDLSRGGMADGAALIKDGHVVGVTSTTFSPAATFQELAMLTPVKILPISDEAYEKLLEINDGYVRAEIPAGHYKGQDEPVPTVSTKTILITNSNIPEEEVYWMTKNIVENIDGLREVHASMKELTVEEMAKIAGIQMHPGAQKYYQEIGIKID